MDVVIIQHVNQFREGRRNPNALLVLYPLHPLTKHLFDNHGKIIPYRPLLHLIQVHKHGHKGGLPVTGHKGNELILDCLDSALDFFFQTTIHNFCDNFLVHVFAGLFSFLDNRFSDLLSGNVHEGGQVRKGKGLSAVLVGSHLCHNLRSHIAGGKEAVRLFNHGL